MVETSLLNRTGRYYSNQRDGIKRRPDRRDFLNRERRDTFGARSSVTPKPCSAATCRAIAPAMAEEAHKTQKDDADFANQYQFKSTHGHGFL